ncbi:molybdenum cofactor biosynthesis protein MoaE [Pseudomarimonas arenosa]|uniref:molybdenum cofactor biosynthesis protein MoaE n=1 Tax=Pseudomarimonas arenosa TaxID=2774145 RepID=UPI003CCDE11D
MENSLHCAVLNVSEAALDPAAALDFVSDGRFGGLNMFVGKVRSQNHGREVVGISYDIYQALALNVFRQLAAEVQTEFGPQLKLYVAHACGRLKVGDIAVVVAAGTPHRDEAFRACRALIEAVKHRAPIWKQEHFIDGDSAWSEGCSLCGHEHDDPAKPPAPTALSPNRHVHG